MPLLHDDTVGSYMLAANDDDMTLIATALDNSPEVAIDTETTGLNVRNGVDYMQGLCFAVDGFKGYIPWRHERDNVDKRWVETIFKILEDKALDWHNMKFDYHSIKTLGIDPLRFKGPQYCSLLMAHLWNEELPSKELDWLAKRFLGSQKAGKDEISKFGEIYGWGKIPPHIMAPYGAFDAELTRRLKSFLLPKLAQQELESVYWTTEQPFNVLLYRMEQRGVGVDTKRAERRAEFGNARMDTIRRRLHFNPASTKDLGHFLLDELGLPILGTTPKGAPSFAKAIMEEYDDILQASNNPTAKMIAEYRGWQKAVSSLYLPLLEKTGPDGRIRTEFKQHGTVTGRLSAANPNLQQVPRGGQFPWNYDAKACFLSGISGYTLIGWDYSQIELRLAAAYGEEEVLLTEFEQEGADPFRVLAPLIYGRFTPEFRQETKTFVYANLYGAGLPKIAAQIGRSVSDTKPLYDNYRASISGIVGISNTVVRLMESRGYIKYWDGRRRHMRNREDSFKAWNSLIQGGAAQLMKQAMLRCLEFCDNDCEMVLTVHDEATFIIKDEAIPDYAPKIEKAMTDWPLFNVKLAVDSHAWGPESLEAA